MILPAPAPVAKVHSDQRVDEREQLTNGGEIGPINGVSIPMDMITSLRGILLDFDPKRIRHERLSDAARQDPLVFFEEFVRPILARHPVYAGAEARASGLGVHGIIRFAKPIEFRNEGDRQRWAGIVRVIQRLVPTDPDCPGLTALTRPIGSTNSKSGRTVTQISLGEPVSPEAILSLIERVRKEPFRTVAEILFGPGGQSPCPLCQRPDSRLGVQAQSGKCYGTCGNVRLGQLFDVFFPPRVTAGPASAPK